mgnify:CR=1 FL=1
MQLDEDRMNEAKLTAICQRTCGYSNLREKKGTACSCAGSAFFFSLNTEFPARINFV